MSFIYNRALSGTLTEHDLKSHAGEINSVNTKTGLTPLGATAWNGHIDLVKLLLEHGADPDGAPGHVRTRRPLWVASARTQKNAVDIVKILLKHGADPNLPSVIDHNSTPVQTYKPPTLIMTLVDAGASPSARNDLGETAELVVRRRNDDNRMWALRPSYPKVAMRNQVVDLLVSLVLFAIAWVKQLGFPVNRILALLLWKKPNDPKREEEVRHNITRDLNEAGQVDSSSSTNKETGSETKARGKL
ncbi:uncharacterized protein PAC_19692 [Phialocephala subalpina]|uniref:Uncharacterized protein n=1 Tax=Phialocephala subalpina TaxID=576137 RepID=A0A1L7XXK4_9HELO|nr:uncharacterized protein PAC_19692 [Phialocephala subalpina]